VAVALHFFLRAEGLLFAYSAEKTYNKKIRKYLEKRCVNFAQSMGMGRSGIKMLPIIRMTCFLT
jgi:hypothetical protein